MLFGHGSRTQTTRRFEPVFTPTKLDGHPAETPAPAQPRLLWREPLVLLLCLLAGAGWSWQTGNAVALPFCGCAALGVTVAMVARGHWTIPALIALGAAGLMWPETARVPWTLGAALGLSLARRAPVGLIVAGAAWLAVFWIREARGQNVPWPILGALLVGGALVGALVRVARPLPKSEFWPLGALAIVGGALGAETLAQGAGVASFALGGALASAFIADDDEFAGAQSLWFAAALVALWRALEALVPALRFGADAGDLTILWGALLAAVIVNYRTRELAPLVCALAPLGLWFGWGPKVVPGLLLGALLAPLFVPRALPHAAVFACALVGLAPLVDALPPQTRADKLVAGAICVAIWVALDALVRWRMRAPKERAS